MALAPDVKLYASDWMEAVVATTKGKGAKLKVLVEEGSEPRFGGVTTTAMDWDKLGGFGVDVGVGWRMGGASM